MIFQYQNLPIYHKFKNKPLFPFFKFFDILADSDNSKITKNGNPIRKKSHFFTVFFFFFFFVIFPLFFFFFFFSYFSLVFFVFFPNEAPSPLYYDFKTSIRDHCRSLYITILRRHYATTSFPNIRVFDAIVGLMADRSHRSGAEVPKGP